MHTVRQFRVIKQNKYDLLYTLHIEFLLSNFKLISISLLVTFTKWNTNNSSIIFLLLFFTLASQILWIIWHICSALHWIEATPDHRPHFLKLPSYSLLPTPMILIYSSSGFTSTPHSSSNLTISFALVIGSLPYMHMFTQLVTVHHLLRNKKERLTVLYRTIVDMATMKRLCRRSRMDERTAAGRREKPDDGIAIFIVDAIYIRIIY